MIIVIDIDIAYMIIVIDIDDGVITVTAIADNRFAERNVLGKPMSRAIQNDIQNIQKMLDKDIEDSSLSGKTPKISLSLSIFLLLQNLTSIYLVGNPVTSNLSELCISPSKMRFKFPPHFY